ncbi:hypothetical protein E8E14_008030 [Neopestalotiopsis sp. 37M]|nr:hypothetical protein E8E14_008030 [Neopestalotiopsis sp. 37M]
MTTVSHPKYALLIGCPRDLKGTERDVESMKSLLSDPAFNFDTRVCSGTTSTRATILEEFKAVIKWAKSKKAQTSDPTVLIYYSGHGGIVEASHEYKSRRFQFIVPADFEHGSVILDVELSLFLKELTESTKNVTIVLDCCHSGRMARIGRHEELRARQVKPVTIAFLQDHIKKLVIGKTDLEGNPDVVRIMSAAPTEVSWEFKDENGQVCGVMTRNLVAALRAAVGRGLSWNTIMTRIIQMVTTEEPSQHPCAEGPSTRVLFETTHKRFMSHPINKVGDRFVIEAGRVAGVSEGNIYTVMPPDYETPDTDKSIGEVKVTGVQGFQARAEPTKLNNGREIPPQGALAFLKEASQVWVAEYPHGDHQILAFLQNAKFLRPREKLTVKTFVGDRKPQARHEVAFASHEVTLSQLELALANHELALAEGDSEVLHRDLQLDDFKIALAKHKQALSDYKLSLAEKSRALPRSQSDVKSPALLEIRREGTTLSLYKNDGKLRYSMVIDQSNPNAASKAIVNRADQIARSQHLLSLNGRGPEKLEHNLEYHFGIVDSKYKDSRRNLKVDGTARLEEGARFYIDLKNPCKDKIYVSIFAVDDAGDVTLVTNGWATGVELEHNGTYTVGSGQWEDELDGLNVYWVDSVRKQEPEMTTFVFVVTSDPVDLRHFVTGHRTSKSEGFGSQLEELAYRLGNGMARSVQSETKRKPVNLDERILSKGVL